MTGSFNGGIFQQVEFVDWIHDVIPEVPLWPDSKAVPDQLTRPATCAMFLAGINKVGR